MERAARAADPHALRITEFVSNLMGAVQSQDLRNLIVVHYSARSGPPNICDKIGPIFMIIYNWPAKYLWNSQIFMEQGQIFSEYYIIHHPYISRFAFFA